MMLSESDLDMATQKKRKERNRIIIDSNPKWQTEGV